MKTDEKITLWSERIRAFQSSGQTCKTWCQEHHVPVSTMSYWMCKLKTLDEQSDTDMIFAKMPTEKEISTNETLNTSLSPVRIFITNSIRIEVMPECPSDLFSDKNTDWRQTGVQSLIRRNFFFGWHFCKKSYPYPIVRPMFSACASSNSL